ncbi:Casein kinase I isoform delta [Dinochytrium kinnereticum]|nr:Casein kinase I isoform delta [Dinochytrium kinnereticum]
MDGAAPPRQQHAASDTDEASDPRQNAAAGTSASAFRPPQPVPLPELFHVCNGRWVINGRIGAGSFGEIFSAEEAETGIQVAIKRELATGSAQLFNEVEMYDSLNGLEGIPKIFYFGLEGPYNVMVMERLGPSLKELHRDSPSGRIPLKTVTFFVPQLLRRLQSVHATGIVFRDIKPDQFCVGRFGDDIRDRPTIYLIDFGLATLYIDANTGLHLKSVKPVRNMLKTGTARYASINVHKGKMHSRRDDLESLAYVLIEMIQGKLPWSGIGARNPLQGWRRIGVQKDDLSVADLTTGLPEEYATFVEYSRELKFAEEPDYEELIRMFAELYMKLPNDHSPGLQWG